MSAKAVAETPSRSLVRQARLTGAMYIPYLAFGLPIFLRSRMIVPSDAAATATNILASESLYRLTIVTDIVSYAIYIVLAYLFYTLLREVSRPWAALGTIFTFAGCFVLLLASATLVAPVLLLDPNIAHGMELNQRQDLALTAYKLFVEAYSIGLFLFGIQWLIMGPLFAKSRVVPAAIGYWLLIGGVGWIAFAVATLLGSPLRTTLQAIVMPVGGLAELALGLWLLIFSGRRSWRR